MQRSYSYDDNRPARSALSSSNPAAGPKRLRGVIVEIDEVAGGGYIRLASRQFRFRTIDVVGSQLPQSGESASFVLSSGDQGYRASQVVLDSNPQFISGQNRLQDCYQAQAKSRLARIERQRAAAQPAVEPTTVPQGAQYRRCNDCQRMVLPKLRRGPVKSGHSAERWQGFCPHCASGLDEPRSISRFHPLPFALLLGLGCAWWLL